MTSPKVKVLKYLLAATKLAQKASDPRERLAALELEIEFTDRIVKAEAEAEADAELPLAAEEPAAFGSGGGK